MTAAAFSPRDRAERRIAVARAILGAFALLAIWLDPSEPSKYARVTYLALGLYVVYALGLWAVLRWVRPRIRARGVAIHAADLAFALLVMYLTEGPTSPFFAYFTFALVAGAMRWERAGVFWTAAVALVGFLALGLYADLITRDPAFELNRFIFRAAYLAVIAILLGQLGVYEARWRERWYELADWPFERSRELPGLLERVLAQAARVAMTPRAVFVWEEAEEPSLYLASWGPDGFGHWEEAPDRFQPWVAASLVDAAFLCWDAGAGGSVEVLREGRRTSERIADAIHPDLRSRFAIHPVLSVPVRSQLFRARLFLLDRADLTADDLALSTVIADRLAKTLDEHFVVRAAEEEAARQARLRVARDLHDDVLQSLSGLAMRLQGIARARGGPGDPQRAELEELQRLVIEEQRRLRLFLMELRAGPLLDASPLALRLGDLAGRIRTVWGLEVDLEVEAPEQVLTPRLRREVYRLTQEALLNVARHANALRARVGVRYDGANLALTVSDDGRGFPFHGRFGPGELGDGRLGPVTLKERVTELGGTLTIESSASGSVVLMAIPAAPEARG